MGLNLTELIVLRELRSRERTGFERLAARAQRPHEIMENVLRGLEKRSIIECQGGEYFLSVGSVEELHRYDEGGQLKFPGV